MPDNQQPQAQPGVVRSLFRGVKVASQTVWNSRGEFAIPGAIFGAWSFVMGGVFTAVRADAGPASGAPSLSVGISMMAVPAACLLVAGCRKLVVAGRQSLQQEASELG